MPQTKLDNLAPLILAWWDDHRTELPWREPVPVLASDDSVNSSFPAGGSLREGQSGSCSVETGSTAVKQIDPYAIWVAEVMLQQTRVATVIPYYLNWMERFPSIENLAAASLDDVLKCWQGLGYYGRVRNLRRSARLLVADYEGRLPVTVERLIKLPGIGRYTAGAIASIAFGQRTAAVDGNVTRVISRLVDYPDDVTSNKSKKEFWELVGGAVPAERPGDFNQALMDLGQQICLVRNPSCHQCPLSDLCLARLRGTQLERPVRPARKKTPHYDVTAAVIRGKDGRFLITKRPLDGMLGGLWEFPGGKVEKGESLAAALQREIEEELAVSITVGAEFTSLKHAYTHYRITLHAFNAKIANGRIQHLGVIDHAWVVLEEMDRYAFAATDLKIINHLLVMDSRSRIEK